MPSKNKNDLTETEERPKRTRGSRIPEGYWPSEELFKWAISRGYDRLVDLNLEAEDFYDYFLSAPDSKGIKKDWDAAFRNWIRRAVRYAYMKGAARPAGASAAPPQKESFRERLNATSRALRNKGS
jgi:hypothetical protein